jgi:peptide/nickel transport system substrate-binding protein
VRNDDYWGEPPPTRVLTFRHIAEAGTRTIMQENKEFHVSQEIVAEDMYLFRDNPDFVVESFMWNNVWFLAFNMGDSITGDLNFRKAVAHAMNRPELTFVAGSQHIPETYGTYYGLETPYKNNNIPIIPFDVDKAKEYLEASVYNGESIEIVAAFPGLVRAAEMLQHQLRQVGIETHFQRMDTTTINAHTSPMNHQGQIVLHTAALQLNAGAFRSGVGTNGGFNRAAYSNPAVDALFDRALSITDENQRRAIFYEIQEIVAADLPFVNIYRSVQEPVLLKEVGGIVWGSNPFLYNFRGTYMVVG